MPWGSCPCPGVEMRGSRETPPCFTTLCVWRRLPYLTLPYTHRCGDHAAVLEGLAAGSADLVVFNLGYLPGGDKSIVTTAEGTVRAMSAAEAAVAPGGCVSVALYPGHEEGSREAEAVLEHAARLPQGGWSVLSSQWINQRSKRSGSPAPSLLLLQRMH